MVIRRCDDVDELVELGQCWMDEVEDLADGVGLDIDMDVILADLHEWVGDDSVVFTAEVDDRIVGMVVVVVFPSHLGKQNIAVEKYWYVLPGHPMVGPRLYVDAQNWARSKGCTHFVASASNLSARCGSVSKFLEGVGATKFEQSYITELN